MINKIILFFVFTALVYSNSNATTYWVGDSDSCIGSTVFSNIPAALLAARTSSNAADEIRLTDTVSYTGNFRGKVSIVNYDSNAAGALTIRGGYENCFSATVNNRLLIGNSDESIISINPGEFYSDITLRNLNLENGAFRGIVANGSLDLTLDNVRIADNQSGIFVTNGAGIVISEDSIIENNDKRDLAGKGGGIECRDENSHVEISGLIKNNTAAQGGNLYIGNGCFTVLNSGAQILGTFGTKAFEGAGAYIDNGGELLSNGGSNRVIFKDNWAGGFGGGIYVLGTGKATLLNTAFLDNYIDGEGIIYAKDGGSSSIQVKMDRVDTCPFLISCSEIENSSYTSSIISADNSIIEINRSIIEGNETSVINNSRLRPLFSAINNAEIRLNRVAVFNHSTVRHLSYNDSSSKMKMSHITAATNTYQFENTGPILNAFINLSSGELSIENSIFRDTQGLDTRLGDFSAKCNLVDISTNWPTGTFEIGTPVFNNLAGGDPRQISNSPAVDMCLQDSFAWSTERDIENQDAPVNDSTNQQGNPGHPDGMYDAGFDEVYTNIGEDEFLLIVQKTGSGDGTIVSTPLGIACGSDCSEVYFNETLVTLFANADSESIFNGWQGCPLVNGNQCLSSIESSQTIIANFISNDDIIFAHGFE